MPERPTRTTPSAPSAPVSRPTLLIVGAFPPERTRIYGGIATACRTLMGSELPERFTVVTVDTTQRSNPAPPFPVRFVNAALRGGTFARTFARSRPDAMLLFCSAGASVVEKGAMAWLGRALGVPSLIFPRGGRLMDAARRSPLQRAWIGAALRGASWFLCQGPAWHRFAVEELGYAADHAPVVLNWTATPALLAIGERRTPREPGRKVQLVFVGWLEENKGVYELIEAVGAVAAEHPVRLTIAGRGHAEAGVRAAVASAGLGDLVRFVGWVEGEAHAALLADADVLVLPSWAEGFPNAVIEALSAKLAVVATTVGNIPDLLHDGDQALLVPPRDPPALTAALRRVVSDRALREGIAERGHAFARASFTVESAVETLTRTVRAAIAEGRGAGR